MGDAPRTVTVLLRDWRAGKQDAFDELVPLVYAELQKIAAGYLRDERPNHTFRPTDLVAEAYLRLVKSHDQPEWQDRSHFFAIAARTMRQVLVDHARKRNSGKRGSGARPITFDEQEFSTDRLGELLLLDEALRSLAAFDERKARMVELHYFGGLTQAEIAEVLGVHVNTVAANLRLAERWIHEHIRES